MLNPPKTNRFMKVVVVIMFALVFSEVVIQFLPYGQQHINPPVAAEPNWDNPRTRDLFFRACANCHSNQTNWPWYSHLAPVSWLVARDVRKGRSFLNISEWGRPRNKGDETARMVEKGEMPLWFYSMVHPEATFSPAEKQEFINGLVTTFGRRREKENKE